MIQQTQKLSTKEQADRNGTGSPENKPGFSLSQKPLIESSEKAEPGQAKPGPEYEEYLGELAADYGTRTVFLTARDPHCLYAYWDWDWRELRREASHGKPVMRVHQVDNGVVEEVELNYDAHNWYVEVPDSNESYSVEIGFASEKGEWRPVAHSQPVHTPSDRLGSDDQFSIASVPFHLHFDELLATLKTAVESGESLADALGRLQSIGLPIDDQGNVLTELNAEQRAMLELLLGRDVWEKMQSGSHDLASLFRAELQSALSSGGEASESLLRLRLAALVGGESSQFSGLVSSWFTGSALSSEVLAGEMSSEMLASWRAAIGETSWQFALTSASWTAALGFASGGFAAASEQFAWLGGSEQLLGGSESLVGLGASEQLSSAQLAAASELLSGLGGSEQLSSYRSKLMSWFAAPALVPTSSWFAAGAQMSEVFSSWQMGVGVIGATGGMSSGALSSETLSSWRSRSFYMHVNAEVIFYGGTDPNAKVWIDGEPIGLDANGNFQYHFKFPDADFEIPIVAESPDGAETRSATLFFRRSTTRQGEVDHTGQPGHLSDPMGRVS